MRNKLKVLVTMCALVLGLSVTAAAQNRYGRRDGRTVTVYQNNRRVYRRPMSRSVIIVPNNRHILRGSRDDGWGNRGIGRARTYRLPNGRLVTVLPNGRRIYH
ncbi:MAG TPA: hypothetical protein VGN95_20265 [Pyrinomonadaceae bacterium]|jgi:hypothetical protein|nr:hypothetical protein [Pyrinomonadaceae bacterium]